MARDLRHAVELALQAPSVHNTQPWLFRLSADEVELHADPARHLAGTDPDHRDLLISCGAVLHHLVVAAAGLGIALEVERLPDPERRHHLATARMVGGPPDRTEAALFGQLGRRRTDRRQYAAEPVPPARIASLVARAAAFGVGLVPATDPGVLARMHDVLSDAATRQRHEPGYLAELLIWTHRYAGTRDGVPAAAVPARPGEPALTRFPAGRLTGRQAFGPDGGLLLVLTTARDDRIDRLAAGEAASAVLLGATRVGLATAPLSQAVEQPQTRERLRRALGMADHPQLVVRIGTPPLGSAPLPATPRRSLEAVLLRR
ncbi:Acg family FMN-binding oxidoreductase [Pseudonocardia xishanensis]|uniref:Nitroreductase family protein n=1 Tax=Pseudonocardia xishanensis TaxID=630995 RepID=A0ABP8RMW9_9PSEU